MLPLVNRSLSIGLYLLEVAYDEGSSDKDAEKALAASRLQQEKVVSNYLKLK